jgi:hypothetical protein
MKDGDKVFEDNGVKVVVDKKSLLYLLGTTLDFSGGLNGKGLPVREPQRQPDLRVWRELQRSEVHHRDTKRREHRGNTNEKSTGIENSHSLCLCASAVN